MAKEEPASTALMAQKMKIRKQDSANDALSNPPGSFRLKAVIHPAAEGGFWAEVPALHGCVTEGETLEEVIANLREVTTVLREVAAEANPPEDDPAALVVEVPL